MLDISTPGNASIIGSGLQPAGFGFTAQPLLSATQDAPDKEDFLEDAE